MICTIAAASIAHPLAAQQTQLQPDKLSANVEERYGYISHNDHMWTTRAGLLFSL